MDCGALQKTCAAFHNRVKNNKRSKFSTPVNEWIQTMCYSSVTTHSHHECDVVLFSVWATLDLITVPPGLSFLSPVWEHPSPKQPRGGYLLSEDWKLKRGRKGEEIFPCNNNLSHQQGPTSRWSPADANSSSCLLQNWVLERHGKKNLKIHWVAKKCCLELSHRHNEERSSL